MANCKVVDVDRLDAGMTATAAAIRAKTGSKDAVPWDSERGFADAVEGIEAGVGGTEVYFSDMGQMYTPYMVIPGGMRYVRDHFKNAKNLITFKQQNGNPGLDSDYGVFSGCSALEEVWVSRTTFGNYFFQLCSSLRKITLGRVGLAVTSLGDIYDYSIGKVEEITCYVKAETIAEIPTSITSKIIPYMCPNATIIYRNSTTGEVITE